MSEAQQLFRRVDFPKAGISRVHVLQNTEYGRWLGCGPFIMCYRSAYQGFSESITSPGAYDLEVSKNSLGKRIVLWNKRENIYYDSPPDVEEIMSRFDTLGAELIRETFKGHPLTIDHKTSSYVRSSIRKCYVLRSSQNLAGIETVDSILVRKSYYDLIYNMWGSDTVVFGKASFLPIIFGKYDDNANFNILGVQMPLSSEHRRFEDNLNEFTKQKWEGIQI